MNKKKSKNNESKNTKNGKTDNNKNNDVIKNDIENNEKVIDNSEIEKYKKLYDKLVKNFDIETIPKSIKYMNLLDSDLQVRLNNSLVIDEMQFTILINRPYVILYNGVVYLIYREGEKLALLFRNGNISRYYEVDIQDYDEYVELMTLLLDTLKPELHI